MDIPLHTPHHCTSCNEIKPHHPASLTCLYCETVIDESYFPYESKGRLEIDLRRGRCWAFLECDPEIPRYYNWLMEKEGFNLLPSLQHPHISFIRDERPYLWDKFIAMDGQKDIPFMYSNIIRTNGFHYWVDVRCLRLFEIRRELGVADDKRLSLHMTVGRRYRPTDRRLTTQDDIV